MDASLSPNLRTSWGNKKSRWAARVDSPKHNSSEAHVCLSAVALMSGGGCTSSLDPFLGAPVSGDNSQMERRQQW